MSKPQVLVLGEFSFTKRELAELKLEYDIIYDASQSREEFFANLDSKYQDVQVIIREIIPNPIKYTNVNEEYISHLPKSLKGFVVCSAGYDDIDIEALSKKNIWVTSAPGVVDDATADTALYLLLGALRNFWPPQKSASEWHKNAIPGHNPKGKLLGILGLGGVGKAVAKRVIALGMTIQYNNRHRLNDSIEKEHRAQYVSFSTLIATSDVILVSIPLNPSTVHLIGKKEIEKMKKGVVIVNVARGKILDEAAIVEGLESGQIGSVGLDVYEAEPEIHPGLLANDRIMLLPHLGTLTVETMFDMELLGLKNVESLIKMNRPISPVNQLTPLPQPKKPADTFDEAEESKEDVEPQSAENAFWMISRNPKRASKVLSQLDFSDLEIKMF